MKRNQQPERRPCSFAVAGPLGSRVSYCGDELRTVKIRFTTGRNRLTETAVEKIAAVLKAAAVRPNTVPPVGPRGGSCTNIRYEEANNALRTILDIITQDLLKQLGPRVLPKFNA